MAGLHALSIGPIQVRATSDAGETWTTSTGAGPAGRHVMAVSFVSATDGWAIFQIDPACPAGALLRAPAPRGPARRNPRRRPDLAARSIGRRLACASGTLGG